MSVTEIDIRILRAVQAAGSATHVELERALGLAHPKGSLERLWRNGFLDCEHDFGKPSIYTVSSRGRVLLRRLSGGAMGDMPAPRTPPSTQPYQGPKWNIRDNGEKHKELGSVRGAEVVPWAPPISMSGSVEAVGMHGGTWL